MMRTIQRLLNLLVKTQFENSFPFPTVRASFIGNCHRLIAIITVKAKAAAAPGQKYEYMCL